MEIHEEQRLARACTLFLAMGVLFLTWVPMNVYAVHVNGYYKSNGTYVNGYERTAPDGNPYNNYSYPGNYNPNTGEITGGNPETYLNNYYGSSSGSSGSYSGYNSYSSPSTPSCPSMSTYDSLSGDCKCLSGYVVSNGSCVTGNSVCWQQMGYMSSYDSISKTCGCDYGYLLDASGQCKSTSSICSSQLGLMSQYNSLSKKCECMSGYTFDGSSCVYKSSSSAYTASAYTALNNCPFNSHESLTDSTKCNCNTGFQTNSTKDACVAVPLKTNDQTCSDAFGVNSSWNGTKTSDGQLNCVCQSGYSWNSTKTMCGLTSSQSQAPAEGTPEYQKKVADLQAQVQALLVQLAALQKAKQ